MPRGKRTKPVAEHIETHTPLPPEAPAPAPVPTAPPIRSEPASVTDDVPALARQYVPDPMEVDMIRLGPDNSYPGMKLWRSNRFQQVAITFPEAPDQKYLDMLEADGWSYRASEKAWTKQFMTKEEFGQMDEQTRAARRGLRFIEAKRLFVTIGNGIRADMGLEPVHALGM